MERPPPGRAPRQSDELAVARTERDLCRARLRQAEAERDHLRADLVEALAQLEYWRTLAEYRQKRLVERQDNPEGKAERRTNNVRLRS
ncbi:MAG: hypothetical protein ACLP36_01330 [Acidimicrobiales bacterium]